MPVVSESSHESTHKPLHWALGLTDDEAGRIDRDEEPSLVRFYMDLLHWRHAIDEDHPTLQANNDQLVAEEDLVWDLRCRLNGVEAVNPDRRSPFFHRELSNLEFLLPDPDPSSILVPGPNSIYSPTPWIGDAGDKRPRVWLGRRDGNPRESHPTRPQANWIRSAGGDPDSEWPIWKFVEKCNKTFPEALSEIETGKKIGHWIWWIFPQAKGLGRSGRSKRYGIGCMDEAVIYLAHRPLGDRYCQIVDAAWWQVTQCKTPVWTLFPRDAKKFVSSLTLFQRAAEKCIAAQIPEFEHRAFERLVDQCADILDAAAAEGLPRCTRSLNLD